MTSIHDMYNQAEKLKDEGQYEEAITKLHEVLQEDETHVLSHLALAVLYGKVGDHEQAVQHGQRACEIDPNDVFNYTALSVTYQRAYVGTQNPQFIQLAEDAKARAHMMGGM